MEKEQNDMTYSVLMSVYYKEDPEWLKISIDSIFNQTILPSEFILVEDGPLTKELNLVIDNFRLKFPDILKVISLEKNVGLGPALNIGLVHCSYNRVVRMDSDDYSIPERAERLLKVSNLHPEYGIIGSYEAEFENNINEIIAIHEVPEKPQDIHIFMKRRCALLHPTVLYKKDVILQCGGYRDALLYEDYDLFLRVVIENNVPCYNIQEPLYHIRINDNFYKRRGGVGYMSRLVKFKYNQYKKSYISLADFIISAGGHAVVCLLPNSLRRYFYLKYLRK